MKNILRKIFGLTVFCLIIGGATVAFGQRPVLGGYKTVLVNDDEVQMAASFAVETKAGETEKSYTLEGVVKAESQSVSGTNYRLCLQISTPPPEDETDGATFYIETVIFKSLEGDFSIKSWAEADCAEK